jgi:hypothetical protein
MSRATQKDLAVRAAIAVTIGELSDWIAHHVGCPMRSARVTPIPGPVAPCDCGLQKSWDEFQRLSREYTEKDANASVLLKHALDQRSAQGR